MTTSAGAERLAVVIPTRDRWPILDRTLQALRRQSVQGFEIVVVVDGADQNPPELGDDVRVVRRERGGPGAARNTGVASTARPLVLFLGDDMVPRPDLVAAHLRCHTAEPADEVAVLGHVRWHPEVLPNPLLDWLDRSAMQFDFASIDGDDAGWARFYSCNVSLKRALMERAGGFDEDFVYYYEDLDAGWRLGRQGMLLRYAPDAVTEHLHAYDEDGLARRFAGVARGELMMAAKHEWFTPWFAARFRSALNDRSARRGWRARSDAYWLQRFAKPFLEVYDAESELAELKAYLGDGFDENLLRGHQAAVDAEERAAPDETTFYRTSRAYLYDLTVFAMSGTKRPYHSTVARMVPPGARLLDYGCGIGSDGLRLLEQGYRVEFADFTNPSTDYLRWRLKQRGVTAPVHDVEQDVPGGFDLVYCFDVIEHVDDPFGFLAELEQRAELVAVNFLEPSPDDVHVHHDLPVRRLLDHVTRRGLVHYRLHHGRSHLVVYRGASPRRQRVRSWARRAKGELLAHTAAR